MWRPANWLEIKYDWLKVRGTLEESSRDSDVFERGADALLEALIKQHSTRIDSEGYMDSGAPAYFGENDKGYYLEVFIPDEEKAE